MSVLMNFEASSDPCTGSGLSCFRLEVIRPIVEGSGFGVRGQGNSAWCVIEIAFNFSLLDPRSSSTFLRAVAAAGFLAALHAERVAGTADDLVAHTGKVADTTAADEHDAMFLQRVAFARN